MAESDGLIGDLAGAILDGAPIDWTSAESGAALAERPLLDELKLLATVANLHRRLPLSWPAIVPDRYPSEPAPDERGDIPEQWGHLRVLERIGRGTFGDVYRAWDMRLDREVALKLMPVSASTSDPRGTAIIEEGRLLARVRHPNVVTIYGAEQIEHRIGLWMELVKGRTLQQTLEQGKTFGATEAIEIGLELCHAIGAVHEAGLVHRDIKPHNVMLAEDGRVVLMDFGTGRELGDGSCPALAGTPLYLAPELLDGHAPTVRSDIYSFGVLLFHLLTGSYPVHGQSLRDLRLAHLRRSSTDVRSVRRDVSPKLARIIERAIDPRPEGRYESAAAVAKDLALLKPRPRAVPLGYALAVAAALVVSVWTGAAIRQRQAVGPSALGTALAAGVVISPTARPVIAVLPFNNLSAEPDSDYLADGLTDEIIRNLAVIQGLEVRSRTSSFAFKDTPRTLRVVGEQLGANLVVEGSVLRSGNRLRINAQLVQVAGDVPLWADRFDRELADIFAIQDEISRAIVTKLRLTLGTGQRRYDTDIESYDLYLRARALVGRRGGADAKAAADLFQQVIAKDSTFAPAYAGLADAYAVMSHETLSAGVVESALPLMQQAAERALELDVLLAEGHAAMGIIYSRQYNWANAEKSFRRAIDLNPSLTQTYVNYWNTTLLPLEKLDAAERLLQVAVRTDPLAPKVHQHLGFMKLIAGRSDEAVGHLERARELDPALPYLDQHLGRALAFAGRWSEALAFFETLTFGSGRWIDHPGGQTWIAFPYVMAGRRAEVEEWAKVHEEPYRLAVIHAALGDKDRALEALDKAADIVPHRVVLLLAYPELRPLRSDPRFGAIRRKLHLP